MSNISPEEFKRQMENIVNLNPSEEIFLASATGLMCKTLKLLGYEDGVKIFNEKMGV